MNTNTKPHLYFIHGWGMNQAVWHSVAEKLEQDYQVTCLDLAGFGSKAEQCVSEYKLQNISDALLPEINNNSYIIGWSLGGLVAQYLAIHHPEKVKALVCVASSPYFSELESQEETWHGIKDKVMTGFQQQLSLDFKKTLERFLAIQAMGSPSAKQDIKQFKQLILQYPEPNLAALKGGLEILKNDDLRELVKNIKQPCLRMYGRLDALVPAKAIKDIEKIHPSSQTQIFAHASHAPFLSHQSEFLSALREFIGEN